MGFPDNLVSSPNIYPLDIDKMNDRMLFCNMSEEGYLASPFLDHRIVRPDQVNHQLALGAAIDLFKDVDSKPAHYIFHNAFCGSTLFSRCVNAHKPALVLREPDILLKIASVYRYANTQYMPNIDPAFIDAVFKAIAGMMCRRYEHNDVVVIKPTDGVNNLMGRLLDHNSENTACLIYSDIKRFLVAIYKYPQRAQFVQARVNELLIDDARISGQFRINPQELSKAQMAAMVWLLHMENFDKLTKSFGNERVMVLNSEEFMADQVASTRSYLDFLKLQYDDAVVSSEVEKTCGSHSKDDKISFDAERRANEFEQQYAANKKDIDDAVTWLQTMDQHQMLEKFS